MVRRLLLAFLLRLRAPLSCALRARCVLSCRWCRAKRQSRASPVRNNVDPRRQPIIADVVAPRWPRSKRPSSRGCRAPRKHHRTGGATPTIALGPGPALRLDGVLRGLRGGRQSCRGGLCGGRQSCRGGWLSGTPRHGLVVPRGPPNVLGIVVPCGLLPWRHCRRRRGRRSCRRLAARR